MRFMALICATCVGLGSAQARDLNIVTDIVPVGSLVSQIAGGEVTVLIQPGQSPHDASLRPSQARALSNADVVVWMGSGLTPSLEATLAELAKNAIVVELLDLEGIEYLESRQDAVFKIDDGHDHGHDDHSDDHADGHDDKHGEGHSEDHHDDHHDDHSDEHSDHHGGNFDPHAWLDPSIAAQWLDPIAQALAQVNPDGASDYTANARQTRGALQELRTTLTGQLASQTSASYFVSHDAFQYFEQAFGINVVGAINASDGSQASVARIRDLQALAGEGNATCLLTDSVASGASMQKTADAFGLTVQPLDILFSSETATDLRDDYSQILSDVAFKINACGSE